MSGHRELRLAETKAGSVFVIVCEADQTLGAVRCQSARAAIALVRGAEAGEEQQISQSSVFVGSEVPAFVFVGSVEEWLARDAAEAERRQKVTAVAASIAAQAEAAREAMRQRLGQGWMLDLGFGPEDANVQDAFELDRRIVRARNAGASTAQIAKFMKISRSRVSQLEERGRRRATKITPVERYMREFPEVVSEAVRYDVSERLSEVEAQISMLNFQRLRLKRVLQNYGPSLMSSYKSLIGGCGQKPTQP